MTKLLGIIIFAIAVIVIALFIYGIRYYNCVADEGKPCAAGTERTSTVSGTFKPPVSGSLKYTCSFFGGKTCK